MASRGYSTKKTRAAPGGDMRPRSRDNAMRRAIAEKQVSDINQGRKIRPTTYFGMRGHRLPRSVKKKIK